MFNPFHPISQLERLISGHTKLAEKARIVISKIDAEEKAAEQALTDHLAKLTYLSESKQKAQRFLKKVEEFIV